MPPKPPGSFGEPFRVQDAGRLVWLESRGVSPLEGSRAWGCGFLTFPLWSGPGERGHGT